MKEQCAICGKLHDEGKICIYCFNQKLKKSHGVTTRPDHIFDPSDFDEELPFTYYTSEEEFMLDCRTRSTDFVKCEYCEFRFKCWTQRVAG